MIDAELDAMRCEDASLKLRNVRLKGDPTNMAAETGSRRAANRADGLGGGR